MNARSENVAMYEPDLVSCPRCGVRRTYCASNGTDVCGSCRSVERTKPARRDIELTGGRWQLDPTTRIQRWVADHAA